MALLSREQIDILITAKNRTDRAFTTVQKNLSSIASSARIAAGAITGFGVAAGAALNNLAETSVTAEFLGLTTDQLRQLQAEARAFAGVTDTQLITSVQRLVRRLGEAQAGNEGLSDAFQRLGIDVNNLRDDLTTFELFRQVGEGVRELDSAAQQFNDTQKILDTEGVRLVALFRQQDEALRSFNRGIAQFSNTTPEAIAQAEAFRAKTVQLQESLRNAGESLILDFLEPWADAPARIAFIAVGIQREFLTLRLNLIESLGETAESVANLLNSGAFGLLGSIAGRLFGDPEEISTAGAAIRAEIDTLTQRLATLRASFADDDAAEGTAGEGAGVIPKGIVGNKDANAALYAEAELELQEHFARLDIIQARSLERQRKAEERQTEVEARERDSRLRGSASFFQQSLSLSARNSKALFSIWKISSIAQAIVSTQTAAANALADVRPYPLNIAAAAAVTAAGLARVAAIRSQSLDSGGGGGASGGGFIGGTVGGGALPPPIEARPADADQQQQSIELVIRGGDDFGRMVVESLDQEVNERDAVVIRPGSRQAVEIRDAN